MDMHSKNYYRIIGVDSTANVDEIKRHFRKMALRHHPDVNPAADSEERFKELNEAYEVLSNPNKRALYDQAFRKWINAAPAHDVPGQEANDQQGRPRYQAAGHSSEYGRLFEELFKRQNRSPDRENWRWKEPANGQEAAYWFRPPSSVDMAQRIDITLEEAFSGCHRRFAIYTTGRREVARIRIAIPPGVADGQTIHLRAKQDTTNVPMRDIYFTTHILPHPVYRLDGRDTHTELPVTLWEAVFGATVSVQTLGGPVQMVIPAHSRNGRKLRLRGRGLPGIQPGDQIVTLKILLPVLTPEEQERLSRWMTRARGTAGMPANDQDA